MAASVLTVEKDIPIGQTEHLYEGTFKPSTSYPTGGEPFDATGNTRFSKVLTGAGVASGGYVTAFDKATQKLKIYRSKDPAAAGGADIPLQEVANAVDLSAVTFEFIALGA